MTNKEIIQIRKASIGDLGEILRLNSDLFKKEYKEYDKTLNLNWTRSSAGKKYYSDRITKKDGFVVIAKYGQKTIGYLCGALLQREFFKKNAKYGELENMSVDKKFRGKGAGSLMTKEFISWCRKNKVDYVSVKASAGNKKGIGFYRKMLFKDHELILQRKIK